MFLRPFFTVLLVLLFCLHATCATIKIRSVPISNTKEVLEHTTEPISPSIHDAPPVAAVLRRSKRHETTIDWREDQALRLESEREAGFRLGSYDDNNNDDDDNE
ncbi:uncharacterized protein N7529_006467 [Penicillium soppii]|uniref:uncharacterized protein n=1 Tax=Penicillium soppii TaxID=69789 RepID=UPI0025472FCF|nr:uncharacterized protein N7529_006467 [Penicillium soppii]KAJ5864551.1 hypothetical protein N7529_006467 [Penicillium soppii]